MERLHWRLDVSDEVELDGRFEIAADAVLPDAATVEKPLALLFCLPGGFLSRSYYDLGNPRVARERNYSFATYLATQGFAIVAIDHLGTGASSRPPRDADGYRLDLTAIVRANQAALRQVVGRVSTRYGFAAGRLPCVGVGHSMGSALTVAQQATYAPHSALLLQTFSTRGLPRFLSEEELGYADAPERLFNALPGLVEARFGTPYPELSHTDPDGRSPAFSVGTAPPLAERLLRDASTNLLAMCGLATMIPGVLAPLAREIRVPVFVSTGDHDLVGGDPAAGMLPNAPGVTSYRLADSWHCHNIANTRGELWRRSSDWARSLPRD